MLWIEKYRPATTPEILGQEAVLGHLTSFAASGTVPHLILTGPHGTGKSAAVECFARDLYKENWEQNTTIFQTADIFSQGKALLEQDPRYAHLFQKSQSLIANFKYIIKWYASLRPLDAEFKLLVFEDAHALTRDAQQALRRIMEQTSGTCRFIFTTTNQSAIIPPIASRCLPLFFAPLEHQIILSHLKKIRETECPGTDACSDDDLDLYVHAARGDMRRAILLLQAALETGSCQDLSAISQSETTTITSLAVSAIKSGDVAGGARRLESLMIDYGLSGADVLSEIRTVLKREYNDPVLTTIIADAECRMHHANNEYLQVGALATGIREHIA